jgi:hypothetical protein
MTTENICSIERKLDTLIELAQRLLVLELAAMVGLIAAKTGKDEETPK